jgi:hypothetical protein
MLTDHMIIRFNRFQFFSANKLVIFTYTNLVIQSKD